MHSGQSWSEVRTRRAVGLDGPRPSPQLAPMRAPTASGSLRPLVLGAMASVAMLVAFQVASRATRDTLFLSRFSVTALPPMIAGAALVSIAAALVATRAMAAWGPERFVPRAFLAGAVFTLLEWFIAARAPRAGAIAVYLHVAALGPVLLSGFWSLVNERFDPRSAKAALGRIAAVGTLGGLAGGLLAERLVGRFGVLAMLPALALAQAWCAWSTARLAPSAKAGPVAASLDAPPTRESYRRLAATPYLRTLAFLVLGSALSAALLDFVFKAQVAGAAARDHDLMRSFSYFYAAVALFTFAIQAFVSRPALERGGLARTMGTLPGALVVGGAVAAILPGPWSVGILRGIEAVLRGSLFRAGYELLYTPIPPTEKRATRILIDVGCDRLGDLGGAVILALVLALAPGASTPLLLVLAALLGAATLGVVIRVQRGYVSSLEAGLRAGAVRLDLAEVGDRTTYLTLQRTLGGETSSRAAPGPARGPGTARPSAPAIPGVGDPAAAREAIRLLADDRIARRVVEALVPVAGTHLALLVEALLDPETEFAVRKRIPAVLVTCPTARSADGLARGLADARFEVRYRCGRALSRVLEQGTGLWVDGDRVVAAVQRECELGRAVWESQRLLDQLDEPTGEDAFVDEFLRDRAGRSLEHVFTLLALVLEREPLRIAFRGLFSGDRILRGTALEYLDVVLPPSVHAVLWSHLEPESARPREPRQAQRDREQVLGDLLRSHRSIEISLEALRQQRPGDGR